MPQLTKPVVTLRRSLRLVLIVFFTLTLVAVLRGGLSPGARAAGTFVVSNTNDSGPGSLRQAILDANTNPGMDQITFSIGSGLQTIVPTSLLPTIDDPVVIDGTTQPGYSGVPLIELSGINQTSPSNRGLISIAAGNSTVRGLIINRQRDFGILLEINGGNHVEGNYIGTDATGNASANVGTGGNGITVKGSTNNVIGGTTPQSRNVISGGLGHGISIFGFPVADGNVIQGNYIGVNASGTAALGNRGSGIFLDSSNNTIGGTTSAARNVIAASTDNGISIPNNGTGGASGNLIQGNYIGTDATGAIALPNLNFGIALSTKNNIVGGTTAGARNVVSGNGWGIGLTGGDGNVIQGNYVGVAADGVTPLGNRVYGILVTGALNTTIGGAAAGAGNTVAYNGPTAEIGVGVGVYVLSATGNSVRGNAIFSNGRLGIDLDNSGVSPNDPGDSDTGGNNQQNFPVVTSVTSDANQTTIAGTLNSAASTNFTLDFYANSTCDSTGFGEGARRIGSTSVTTNGSGDAAFSVAFAPALSPNQVVTATATDPSGNTSEFSQCSPTAPSIGSVALTTNALTISESVGLAVFSLTRTGGTAGSLSIGYQVIGETATVGADFSATQGTVTFADGETAKTISIPITDDNVFEPVAETAKLRLSAVGDLDTLGAVNVATLTINDNDTPPAISIGDVILAEGNAGTTNFVFPITLSNPDSSSTTITFSTANGTATLAGDDYLAPNTNSVIVPAGQTAATITVAVLGDTKAEGDETFFVNLTSLTNGGDSQGMGTIVNDDGPPTTTAVFGKVTELNGPALANVMVTVTFDRMGVIETRTLHTDASGNYSSGDAPCANNVTVTPTLSGRKFSPVSISFINTCGDQLANFSAIPTVVINQIYTAGGDAGATFRNDYIELVNRGYTAANLNGWSLQYGADNGTSWPQRTFLGGSLQPGQHFLIQGASAGINGASLPQPEIFGGMNLSSIGGKVVLLSSSALLPSGPCPLSGAVVDLVGYGAAANCFEGAGPAPAPSATTAVRRNGDGCNDSDQNAADFALGTPNPRNRFAPATPCGATVQFSATNYNVSEGGVAATLTVTRSTDTSGTSTVDFATSDGSALQNSDYVVATGTLTFAPGETSKTFNVLIVDEGFVEANEVLNLGLSNATGAAITSPATATITINDNDSSGSTSPAAKRFAAALDGSQETPSNNSTAQGTGLVLLNGNETSALVGLQFHNLSSAETAAHVHGPANPGVAAPIIFPLPGINPFTNFSISPTTQQVSDLKASQHYLNVHSNNFANGEIRGQLRWNPTLEESFFVRQQYLDFLSRDGDPGGFNFWVGTITPCQADWQCFHDRTIAASDAFFFEPEFQQTAGFVFRAYRAAFGNMQPFPNPSLTNQAEANKLVNYATFVGDRARVVGGADLAAAQLSFANLFVARTAFTARYSNAATAAQFVDAMLATIQSADSVDLTAQRQALIDQYNNAGGSDAGRAMVLYRLADENAQNPINNQSFINAEYNRQFALTLYFGYLRRNPDIDGFLFWQSQINLAPVRDVPKQNALVCSFITAVEYQFRFGNNTPRTNNECPQ